jgi:hypothetical protein
MNATDTIEAIRALENKVHLLRSALVEMIGADGLEELRGMQQFIAASDVPAEDRIAASQAVSVLIATLPSDGGQTP